MNKMETLKLRQCEYEICKVRETQVWWPCWSICKLRKKYRQKEMTKYVTPGRERCRETSHLMIFSVQPLPTTNDATINIFVHICLYASIFISIEKILYATLKRYLKIWKILAHYSPKSSEQFSFPFVMCESSHLPTFFPLVNVINVLIFCQSGDLKMVT